MNFKYIWLPLLVVHAQAILPHATWALESKRLATAVVSSTSAFPVMFLKTGGVQVNTGTMEVKCEQERLVIREKLVKGDVCGAATDFNALQHGDADPTRMLMNDMLNAFDIAPPTEVMGCASAYAALLKKTPRNPESAFGLVALGKEMMDRGEYVKAQFIFMRMLGSYWRDKYAPWAIFYNAECDFNLKQYDQAAAAYRSYYEHFPEGTMVQRAKEQELLCRRMMKAGSRNRPHIKNVQ